jgi:hypothetical protein
LSKNFNPAERCLVGELCPFFKPFSTLFEKLRQKLKILGWGWIFRIWLINYRDWVGNTDARLRNYNRYIYIYQLQNLFLYFLIGPCNSFILTHLCPFYCGFQPLSDDDNVLVSSNFYSFMSDIHESLDQKKFDIFFFSFSIFCFSSLSFNWEGLNFRLSD